MLNLSQSPSPQSSHYQPAITALLHSQQAEEGKKKNRKKGEGEEEESGLSGVKIERERNVIVR